jgi:hypothetical protein
MIVTPELPAADPEPVEPPTTLISSEPPTTLISSEQQTTAGSVWPGLTAAGLPTRVPRQADEDSIKEAFFQSWEAEPTSPTPLTRPPFTPTYLDEPPRRSWASDPPGPREPPDPAEPPEPAKPPEPKEPPAPPTPQPGPTPFPSPTPVPTPPEPLPTPPIPPGPPVPTPPPPFPPPPGPVPPPPAIVPGAATPAPVIVPGRLPASVPGRPGPSVFRGGNYSELETEPITVTGVTSPVRESAVDRSGSLTGHLLSREMRERREKRRRMKSVLWVVSLLLLFGLFLATVVILLAGDFLGGLFDTFSRWAG